MRYTRRYLQFNELVFDGYDMIQDTDGGVSFKTNSTEKSFGHGSYAPLKANYMFSKEQSISMTITLRMKKLPCDVRPFYVDFAIGEVSKPGKLWKVQNGQLMWAYAIVESFDPDDNSRENQFSFDIDFMLPEGVWHKADKHRTFLVPYNVCTFMDCKKFHFPEPCCPTCERCDVKEINQRRDDSCDCCCEDLSKDMALCYNMDKIADFYSRCASSYQIVYDCEKGDEFFGDENLGSRLCVDDSCEDSVIAGLFYSDTDIPTTGIEITIKGKMLNPAITINDVTNIINGSYDGILTVKSSGDVYYGDTIISPEKWEIPGGVYGWEVHRGLNSVVVELNACCSATCIYIHVDSLSI